MTEKDQILEGIWSTIEKLDDYTISADVAKVKTIDLIKAHKLLVEALVIIAAPMDTAKLSNKKKGLK